MSTNTYLHFCNYYSIFYTFFISLILLHDKTFTDAYKADPTDSAYQVRVHQVGEDSIRVSGPEGNNHRTSPTEGALIFDASLGPGWYYAIDHYRSQKDILQFLTLDSSRGRVYSRGAFNCVNMYPVLVEFGALHVYITAHTYRSIARPHQPGNYTVIPLSVYIYGPGCYQNHRRKSDYKNVLLTNSQLIVINRYQDQIYLPMGEHLLSVRKYIPASLQKNVCAVTVHNTRDYLVTPKNYTIMSKTLLEPTNNGLIIHGDIEYGCSKTNPSRVSFKILYYVHKSLTLVQVSKVTRRRRHRRATNNVAPYFVPNHYHKRVMEEAEKGILVGIIKAIDTDTEDAGMLTYSLIASQDARSQSMFTIDRTSGSITTLTKLDREQIPVHYFTIIATDNGIPQKSGSASLIITVTDDNDHTPLFEKDVYVRDVSENIDPKSIILTVRATDKDSGNNAKIQYSILNPDPPNDAFSIDPIRGTIQTQKHLDREKVSFYNIIVQAMDQGIISKRRSSTATVQITVTDENDNYPQFELKSYTKLIPEDIDVSSKPVILNISATDKDEGGNSKITYTISGGNSQDFFKINSMTGALSLQEPLDYEETNQYTLKIRAQDSGSPPKTNSTTVNIRVKDVNDNAPAFLGTYHESIMENKPANTSIRQVQAFDPDSGPNAQMTFKIIDKPAYFPLTIDPKTGWIRTTAILDRENATSYRFIVEVKDSGNPPKSATTEVILIIRDANDNKPVFNPKVYNVNVSEEANPGERVVVVHAVDLDEGENAVLTYRITDGNINSAFRIITSEGIILVAKTLNYREHSRYTLTVTATDPIGNQDEAEVFIQIIDTNRYRPKFQNTPYRISVSEDVPVGKSIYEIFALDKDVGENARITYSMDPTDVFAVDPNTGIVHTRAVLDREKQAGYTVSVTATDQGKPPKMDTTDLVITVEDVNDNQPEFKKVRYSGSVLESAEIGTRVVEISATDKDAGRNGQIYYTFKNGYDGDGDFIIDSTQGAIRTNKKLDRERVSSYELMAYAVDRGSNPMSASVVIDINIEDVNDNKPMFEAQEIRVSILENSPIGSTVAKLTANDPDVGENAEIEYMLKDEGDRDSFELSGRPGSAAVIISMVDLDYESDKKSYRLSLRAISRPLFSDVTVIISVEDINDNKPELQDFTIIINNFVNYFPTGVIGRIPAYDPDEINRDTLIYSFFSGNEGNLLKLNSSTGDITLDSRLNSDVARNGTLQVSVSDGLNEARAVCRLYVRLVTDDMLRHSVTIRLNNMTSEAFLSPLFRFFINALATILHTDEKNILVINVQDDTDVPAQILNVSVTVNSGMSNGKDIFLTPQYLREQIYLQRAMLANLSTLQVLPFDDNLCVMEPCLNFEVCMTRLRFGSAAPFIKSSSMLFRPIHPINSYQCLCPPGFTGMTSDLLCDVEVNLCYSSPCHTNSTCVQQEGGYVCLCPDGFTGRHCEIDMNTIYEDDMCPHKLCRPPSVCETIPTGGFYCKGCPTMDYHNEFCELTTRQFFKGSYLMFPSLKKRQRFVISLNFTTQEKNGLLFYNGRYNEKHDFIALEVVDTKVQFSFSLGSNITSVQAEITGGVSDGKWHQVTVEYHNRTATVSIDADCDTGVAIHYRHLFDNYRCANRATMILDDECAKVTEICHRLLDLTGPLQIGGLPRLPSKFLVENTDFVGCIKDFHIDHVLLDLNTSVAEKDTQPGCAPKKNFCLSSPCKHGGTCMESWGTFRCECVEGTAGKTCEDMVGSFKLKGGGYLSFNNPNLEHISFPWYNGISFRTRAENGVLLDTTIQGGHKAIIKLQNGFIVYEYGKHRIVYSHNKVNDGQWHYVQTNWFQEELNIVLDHITDIMEVGEISDEIAGKSITRIYIGAQHVHGADVSDFLVGCVKNIRIGNDISKSLLSKPQTFNAETGCSMENPCLTDNPCRPNTCVDTWGQYKCDCLPGRIGSNCTDVCDNFNPCQNMGICHRPTPEQSTYTCECGRLQFGRYCQISLQQPCPAAWWGYPICGPCNCDKSKGFDPVCEKTTGACSCKTNHYRPKGTNQCFPCNCYPEGSMGPSCDKFTGQCRCHKGVIGRRCDSCSSRFAEVHEIGCRVVYDVCPRNFAHGIWWDRTFINEMAVQDCPSGAIGDAKRNCTKTESWLEPDLFNCTGLNFRDLHKQLQQIQKGSLKINTYVSKTLMRLLAKAAKESTRNYFGNDLKIVLNLIKEILRYENKQEGLSLTSEQDRGFIKNMLIALSYTYTSQYRSEWNYLNQDGGAMELTMLFEKYMHTLATSMALSQSWPFQVVSHNIVLAIDSINMRNQSAIQIPKYDNIVPNSDMFDKDTHIQIPRSLLVTERSIDVKSPPLTPTPKGIIGYMIYRTLGEVLPHHYDQTVRNIPERPMTIGTPVISLILQNRKHHIKGQTTDPINITFKQLTSHNRSSPQCVYWQPLHKDTAGYWSRNGCAMTDRYELKGENYVVCSCTHLSTYAVLMDMTNVEFNVC